MFEKFKPLGDRVLVKRLEGQEKTAGGIIYTRICQRKGANWFSSGSRSGQS